MFFHVDPADHDALLGYAYEKARESYLRPLPGCVDKEASKHRKKKKRSSAGHMSQGSPDIDERERKDYFTPVRENKSRALSTMIYLALSRMMSLSTCQ